MKLLLLAALMSACVAEAEPSRFIMPAQPTRLDTILRDRHEAYHEWIRQQSRWQIEHSERRRRTDVDSMMRTRAVAPGKAAPSDSALAAWEESQREWRRNHAAWVKSRRQWEEEYLAWLAAQPRLDDGLLLSLAGGFSRSLVQVRPTGGNPVDYPPGSPYPELNLSGLGGTLDLKLGWLVENDWYLKGNPVRGRAVHDQLYLSLDLFNRLTPRPQLRAGADTGSILTPAFMLESMGGLGMTYVLYPYLASFSATVGLGFVGVRNDGNAEGRKVGYSTNLGPALNIGARQEWSIRENWKSGVGIHYGFIRAVNPAHYTETTSSYREPHLAHLFSLQWTNTFTPPKYRRVVPVLEPQRWFPGDEPAPGQP